MLLNDSNAIYIGDTVIDSIYIGSDLIWTSGGPIYTQLQYIQSTNCQTINTGYIPNENSRIEAVFMLHSNVHSNLYQALFGNGTNWKFEYNHGYLRTDYVFGSGNISTTASVLPYHKKFRVVCDKTGATWYDENDTQLGTVSVDGSSFSASDPIYIGSNNKSNYGEMRIYAFKIYEGSTLIMDLAPVQRNSDGVCGLVDQVSHQFFVDSGAQNAGYYSDRFIDSYIQLEAADTSGNMYVDTDYIPDVKTKLIIDSIPMISLRSGVYNEILLGTRDSLSSTAYSFGFAVRDVNNKPYYFRGSTYLYFGNTDMMQRRSTITLYMDTAVVKFDDETTVQSTIPTPSSYDNVASLWLFNSNIKTGRASTAYSYTRFYNCMIKDVESGNETLIHDFTPVKRVFDNVITLYDAVSGSEYAPSGGSFSEVNIFSTLTFSGGWLDTDGTVQHQTVENYGTSDFFPCGNNTKIMVSFTPQYTNERGVMVCAYDENQTFISSPIYTHMIPPYPTTYTEFTGDIPPGAVYLRYSYLWGKYNSRVPSDLDTVIHLSQ